MTLLSFVILESRFYNSCPWTNPCINRNQVVFPSVVKSKGFAHLWYMMLLCHDLLHASL